MMCVSVQQDSATRGTAEADVYSAPVLFFALSMNESGAGVHLSIGVKARDAAHLAIKRDSMKNRLRLACAAAAAAGIFSLGGCGSDGGSGSSGAGYKSIPTPTPSPTPTPNTAVAYVARALASN